MLNTPEGKAMLSAVVRRTEMLSELHRLLSSLEFDEELYGGNPKRCTLDFPKAILSVKRVIAQLDSDGVAP